MTRERCTHCGCRFAVLSHRKIKEWLCPHCGQKVRSANTDAPADVRHTRIVLRAQFMTVELEELDESIRCEGVTEPGLWSEFDVKRNTLDVQVARRLLGDVTDKLQQVGRWDEIIKSDVPWRLMPKTGR